MPRLMNLRARAIKAKEEAERAKKPIYKPKLKPCPFCGGPGNLNYKNGSSQGTFLVNVACDSCGIRMTFDPDVEVVDSFLPLRKSCVKKWNTRKAPKKK